MLFSISGKLVAFAVIIEFPLIKNTVFCKDVSSTKQYFPKASNFKSEIITKSLKFSLFSRQNSLMAIGESATTKIISVISKNFWIFSEKAESSF